MVISGIDGVARKAKPAGEDVTEAVDTQTTSDQAAESPVEDYTRLSARFTLSQFELRLFQNELPLVRQASDQ